MPDEEQHEKVEENAQPPVPEQVRLHAIVHGRVQGVGFRAHTQRAALYRELTGWAQNQWDGTVEVVAEGPRVVLEQFEQVLHVGPTAASVDRVEITYHAATGEFSRFSIRY